jgi:hypothetical protein
MPQTFSAAAAVATPGLKSKMSKKDLKAAKVEAAKIEHIRKAEEKAALAKAKADKKEAEIKAKEEMKRKEKEEKERRKAEKKAKKTVVSPITTKSQTQTPFPRTSAPIPAPPNSPPRRTAQSMPLGTTPPPSSFASGNGNGGQSVRTKASESTLRKPPSKLGFLGTLKKRFSSGPSTSLAEVRRRHESDAANVGSMPPPPNSTSDFSPSNGIPQTPKEVRTSSMAAGAFSTPPPAQDFAQSSLPPVEQAPLDLAPIVSTTEELSSPTNEEERSTSTLIPRHETPSSPPSRSLAKVTSRDQTSIRSSHSRTRSASLHGPRPMPRPESINLAQPIPPTETSTGNGNGFPFRPVDLVTPTTSAESSMFSNISQGEGDGEASPFTSIDSRKNSLDGAAALETDREGGLERHDSTTPKASDETETRQAIVI